MPLDQMAQLEKRVHQLLELVKRLKQDNALLDKRVRTIGQRLSKRERDTLRWNHDRGRLRSKVERILTELGSLSARSSLAIGEGARPRKRGCAGGRDPPPAAR